MSKDSLPDLTGEYFGDCRIIRKIGVGAMAEVFLADQKSLDRRVALKILKPHLAEDQTYVSRFVREAKAAARLVHPNIVHIYEVDQKSGYWYISQEYVSGTTLAALIKKEGALPGRRVFEIIWQVTSALSKASQEGIVHRDIKPENILLGGENEVKVADFGLARVTDNTGKDSTNLTAIGMTLGTPLYMSPEQSEGKATDVRSDIYSLGITCYHALAGNPPFRGENALSVAIQHLRTEAEPLELIRPDIPVPFARIIHKMIAKMPAERYQSAFELQQELKKLFSQYFSQTVSVESLSEWSVIQLDGAEQQTIGIRQRLQKAMAEEQHLRRRGKRFIAELVIAAALFGGIAAFAKSYFSPSLPMPPLENPEFPKMNTVSLQWMYASKFDTEAGWQSVIEYFPDDEMWSKKARQQLARHYMEFGSPLSAMAIFQTFADSDETEISDRAFGFSGLMWGYAQIGDDGRANQCFYEIVHLHIKEFEPMTQYFFDSAIKTIGGTKKAMD